MLKIKKLLLKRDEDGIFTRGSLMQTHLLTQFVSYQILKYSIGRRLLYQCVSCSVKPILPNSSSLSLRYNYIIC